jgi:hypothetical protein
MAEEGEAPEEDRFKDNGEGVKEGAPQEEASSRSTIG